MRIVTSHRTNTATIRINGRAISDSRIRRDQTRTVGITAPPPDNIPVRPALPGSRHGLPCADRATWAVTRRAPLPVLADSNDLHGVRPAGLAHRLADGEHDEIAALDLTLFEQQILRGAQDLVAIGALLEIERAHVAVKGHLALRRDLGRQREDRATAVVARNPQRGRARLRQCG